MDSENIYKLCGDLVAAAELVQDLYFNNQASPELKKALARLWDCCQDYQTTFENFSRQ